MNAGAVLLGIWNLLLLRIWLGAYRPGLAGIRETTARAWRDGEFSAGLLARNWAGFAAAGVLLAGILGVAAAAGARLRGWLGGRSAGGGARASGRIVAVVLGLGVIGSAVLGLGMAGLLFAPPWWASCLILLPVGLRWLRRVRLRMGTTRAGGPPAEGPPVEWPPVSAPTLVLLAAAVLLACGAVLSVETGWDALMYHLRIPSFWGYHHRIYHVWHSYYGGYPSQVETLYALGQLVAGDALARMLNAAFGVIVCCAAAAFARELPGGPTGGPGGGARLSPLLVACCPVFLALLPRAYADLGLAAFGSLALLEWVRGLRTGSRPAFLSAAVLAGFAMGTKYAGVLLVPAMLAAGLPGRGARWVALVAPAAALPVLPWLAKNWVFLGNPVFPFLGSVFGASSPVPADVIPWFDRPEPLAWFFRNLPARATALLLEPGHLESPVAPVFAGLLPLVCLREPDPGRRRARRAVLAFVGGWAILVPEARFVLPALPGLAALIAVRLEAAAAWTASRRAGLRLLVEASVLAGAAWGFQIAATTTEPFGMLLGRRSALGLLAAGLPPAPYRAYAAEAVNAVVPRDDRVLVVSHFSTYYIDRECLGDFHTGRTKLAAILAEGRTAPGIARRLRQLGVRWLLFTGPGVMTFAKVPGAWDVPEGAWDGFARVMRERSQAVWQTDWFALFRLGAARAPRPLPALPAYETLAFAEADRMMAEGDPAGALARYGSPPPLLADVGSTFMRRAVACMALGRWAAADAALRRARALGVDTPGLHLALAQESLQQGRAADALPEAEAARRLDPLSPTVAMGVVPVLTVLGRPEDAVRAAEEARRLRPEGRALRAIADGIRGTTVGPGTSPAGADSGQ